MLSPQIADRIVRWLMPFIVIGAALSGMVFWARRVGWLQADVYWHGHRRMLNWYNTQTDYFAASEVVSRFNNSVHDTTGWLWLTKLPKELVLLALLLVALTQYRRIRLPREFTAVYAGLFALATGSALTSLLAGRWIELLAGSRSFAAWVLGATLAPSASTAILRLLARVCVWTLVLQGILVAIEMQRGLLIYSMSFLDMNWVRAVGSFNLPISLGTFAVVAWAAAWSWGELPRWTMGSLTLLTLALLLVSASGASWFAFAAAGLAGLMHHLELRWRVASLLLALPLSILLWFALPDITGRGDIHDSLWGRIYPVQVYAAQNLSATEIAFGSGFGRGTNALTAVSDAPAKPVANSAFQFGDSLPATLFWQVGAVGLVLAYSLMMLALRADVSSRPIGVAILVSSIAVNVTELFPVNLMLGFWLAHATRPQGADEAHA